MERQFLILSLFILFGLLGCQSNPAVIKNIDAQCVSSSLGTECTNEIVLPIEEPKPVAKNVWDYMIINNNYDNNIVLDEKTIRYINNHIKDTSLMISNAIKQDKNILFEGAQGTLLDIDHGTYPFVTSSNTSSANAAIGSGVGPLNLNKIVGVTKAYISRVGSGPFITEQKNDVGDYLIEKGAEFGVVTGRRRRCGWLDLISLKYSVRVNSLTELFITKLDVLSGLDEIKLGVGYKNGDEVITDYPYQQDVFYNAEPVYETFEGWSEDITSVKNFDALPENAKKYINAIEKFIEIPITFISVGPERNQNIVINND